MPEHSFSVDDRKRNIRSMQSQIYDLVIIGGGITGAGTARDAASRGMKVALVEGHDFAQGTSSRSSKLIHGGIRYLENMEFGLVFEALSERRVLFEMAPHLVHPLRFVLPLYRGGRVGMFKMGLGMWLYDALSLFEAPELHERLNPAETVERLPLLQGRDLLGSYVYSDAYMDDDRLVLETLRAAAAEGATCANYVRATGAEFDGDQMCALLCRDEISGETLRIRGRHFISTVGPWTDRVASDLLKTWRPILRPSKGIHLTFKRSRIPLSQAVVMAADKERRIVFGIPRHEMIIIGTTDTDFKGDPQDVRAEPEDVRYLLNVANEYFPGARLTADDIVASYAGVRPLVDDGSVTESKTSREHTILVDPRNITFVAGGKYTTYRRMAEQTVEATLERFPLEDRVRFRLNNTLGPLNPKASPAALAHARLQADRWARESGLAVNWVRLLVERHGAEAVDLLNLLQPGDEREVDEVRFWLLEARHAVLNTMCLRLVDFYTRRVPLFLARSDHGLEFLSKLSGVFAERLAGSDSKRQEEEALVHAHIARELAWRSAF